MQLEGKWAFSLPTGLVAELFCVVNRDFWELCIGSAQGWEVKWQMWPYSLLPLSTSCFLSRWKPGDFSHLPITIIYPACIADPHILPTFLLCTEMALLLLPGPSPPPGAAASLLSFTQGFCFMPLFLQHWQFPPLCRIILIYITVCFIISQLSFWPISPPSLIAKLFIRVIMCYVSHTMLLLLSRSVASDSLRSHGLRHARLHQLPECPQTHVHWVSDTIQPSRPLSPTSLPVLNLSQHRGFFQWVGSSHWWPKYWIFSFSPSNDYSGLISFRIDWFDLLSLQETLKSLLQHHSSKASVLQCSAFFWVQLSHPYMTTGKTIALTRWTFVGKAMSLLFNMLSRFVITFLPRASVF